MVTPKKKAGLTRRFRAEVQFPIKIVFKFKMIMMNMLMQIRQTNLYF